MDGDFRRQQHIECRGDIALPTFIHFLREKHVHKMVTRFYYFSTTLYLRLFVVPSYSIPVISPRIALVRAGLNSK